MKDNHSKITRLVLLNELYKSTGLSKVKKQLDALGATEDERSKIEIARQYSTGQKNCTFQPNVDNHITSVFSNLQGAGGENNGHSHIPKRVLSLDNFPFPKSGSERTEQEIINEFLDKLVQYQGASGESLLYLAEKYLTNLPVNIVNDSGERILTDISLFDHISTVLGLTLCVKKCQESNQPVQFLMVGGDISGIQKFIYSIVSKNASKNLKGRSFYLQLLVDSILQRLLNSLNLSSANIIYSSGGGFYMLAPNIEATKDAITELRNELSDKLWDCLLYTSPSPRDLSTSRMPSSA